MRKAARLALASAGVSPMRRVHMPALPIGTRLSFDAAQLAEDAPRWWHTT
jgi:hypothetical protein